MLLGRPVGSPTAYRCAEVEAADLDMTFGSKEKGEKERERELAVNWLYFCYTVQALSAHSNPGTQFGSSNEHTLCLCKLAVDQCLSFNLYFDSGSFHRKMINDMQGYYFHNPLLLQKLPSIFTDLMTDFLPYWL